MVKFINNVESRSLNNFATMILMIIICLPYFYFAFIPVFRIWKK